MLTTAIIGNLDDGRQALRIAEHLTTLMGRPFRVEPATNDLPPLPDRLRRGI